MFNFKALLSKSNQPLHILRQYSTKSELKTFTQKKEHYGDAFPDKLFHKKHKAPASMYLANEKIAHKIYKRLHPYFQKSSCNTILEMNPGLGVFTRRLLDNEEKFKKILLLEPMDHFMDNLEEMHTLYPDRVKVKQADFVNISKLVFQDKLDNGSRVEELLRDIPCRKWEDDPNLLMFGAVGSYNFFKNLITSVIFQNSFLSFGRAEMYIVLPPPIYLILTCTKEIGYLFYRSTTILFQMLFEHQFIAYLPREDFLPMQIEYNFTKASKLTRIRSVNPECLYLVRIVPRRDISKYVAPEDFPALWYFVKQNCMSRSNRIIPSLEKWVPGCGPRLIVNTEKTIPSVPLYDDEDETKLPKYSTRCRTLSDHDFYPNINIYTQFGDLSAGQMLTLFSLFRQWPEYKESSFLASFENSMIKMETSLDTSTDGIAEDDDDLPTAQSTEEETVTEAAAESNIVPSASKLQSKSKNNK